MLQSESEKTSALPILILPSKDLISILLKYTSAEFKCFFKEKIDKNDFKVNFVTWLSFGEFLENIGNEKRDIIFNDYYYFLFQSLELLPSFEDLSDLVRFISFLSANELRAIIRSIVEHLDKLVRNLSEFVFLMKSVCSDKQEIFLNFFREKIYCFVVKETSIFELFEAVDLDGLQKIMSYFDNKDFFHVLSSRLDLRFSTLSEEKKFIIFNVLVDHESIFDLLMNHRGTTPISMRAIEKFYRAAVGEFFKLNPPTYFSYWKAGDIANVTLSALIRYAIEGDKKAVGFFDKGYSGSGTKKALLYMGIKESELMPEHQDYICFKILALAHQMKLIEASKKKLGNH